MLILSSYGFGAPIVEEIYRKHIKTDGKVLIVPFAGLDFGATVKYEKEFLKRFGFEEKNIYVCGFNNTEEIKNIPFQYIYTCAGDTFKLLDALKKNNLINFIKNLIDCGATYIGVSAGAYVCTSDIKYVTCLEDNNCITDDFSALNLILACLITIFSFKETADFADDNKNPAEIEKEDEGEPTSDTLIEANDDEKTVGKVWFKRLKPVIILVVFLFLVISINDDPLMLFSVLALSMIASSVIGVGCAYFSEKEHYKHYKTTIIVSSVVIGLFSFGIKLFENLHLSAVHHFIIPELLCFPVMLTLTNVGIAVLIQMINRKQSSKQ